MVKLHELAEMIKGLEVNIQTLTDTVSKLKNEMVEVKTSIEFVSNGYEKIDKTVSDISQRFDKLEGSLNTAENRYHELQAQYKQLQERIIAIESKSRRENLLIDGLPEPQPGQTETTNDCQRLVRDFFKNQLKMQNVENIRAVRCYRLGRPPSTGTGSRPQLRPRTMRVMFNWLGDRETVWGNRKHLRGSKFQLSEDFPKEIVDRRKRLTPIMQAARRKGLTAFLTVDKLHILQENGKRDVYAADELSSLPPDLDPRYVTTQRKDNYMYFFGFLCPLSNFHDSPFVLEGRTFRWVEEYFFHKKAELFNDLASVQKIKNAESPVQCKSIGHSIKGDINAWRRKEVQIMKKALQEKFGQNPDLKDFLIRTGDVQLAEASPTDSFWGTGVGLGKEVVSHKWKGKNKLGELLMELRTELS